MSRRTQLPRWPLRMHLWRLPLWLFGWINPDSRREYKRLLQENRRLRKAIRARDRRERLGGLLHSYIGVAA